MAIKQVTTANTFQEWLTATQSLITHYNDFDDTANLVFLTANDTVQVFSDTSNVYSNTVIVYNNTLDTSNDTTNVYNNTVIVYNDTVNTYSNTVNTYNDIQSYVSVAYDAANNAYDTANNANTTAYEVLAILEASDERIEIIDDTTTNSDNHYITFIDATDLSDGNTANIIVSSTKLYYNPSTGTLNSTNYNALSDLKLKDNVLTIQNSIDTINNLNGVEFTWKETGKKSFGIIAQELEKILPELVEGTDYKTVNYSGIIAFLINAVKELDDRIKKLEE